ncbi:DapH/DapD/GlmU-related protein [Halobaculum sp. MBLA0147]|uniref:acyltransferase n=1 Tax=Halobaculum sp. MBLA0147 TaxID=3079934 RepID=UPI0035248076
MLDRYDRVERTETPGEGNSLRHWQDAKSYWEVAKNYLGTWVIRVSGDLDRKNRFLRRLGVTVGENVSWGLEATPDVFWPERITLGDDVIVGYDATILCHEFLQDEYRVGDVVVGDRAMIGAGAVILPGVEIGHDAQVAANSLVADDVPPETTVAGVPAEPLGDGDEGEGDARDDLEDRDARDARDD